MAQHLPKVLQAYVGRVARVASLLVDCGKPVLRLFVLAWWTCSASPAGNNEREKEQQRNLLAAFPDVGNYSATSGDIDPDPRRIQKVDPLMGVPIKYPW